MPTSSRSGATLPRFSWLTDEERDSSHTRAANEGAPRDLRSSSLGARYWIEGTFARPTGCVSHRATRRLDDEPAWIVIPASPSLHKFANAMPFIQTARTARRLRHPYILRTLETGLLYDGRPFVVVERLPSESLGTWIAHRRKLPWNQVQSVALRLCSAVEAARRAGLAPRNLDLDGCLHVREGIDDCDVRLGELFVPASARLPESDAAAVAMIVHALGGGRPNPAETGALGNVLVRALGNNGYADIRDLARALAAIERDGVRESQGANHACVSGQFEFDEIADERETEARPIPWTAEYERADPLP